MGIRGIAVSKYLKHRFPVFLFHEIGNTPSEFQQSAGIFMDTHKFELLLDWISNQFTVQSLDSLLSGQPIPSNSCAITFDDCWKGALTLAPQLLTTRKLPATFFLNASVLDGNPDLAAYAYLINPGRLWPTAKVGDEANAVLSPLVQTFSGRTASWKDIENLDPALFTLGNHLYWHSNVMTGSVTEFEVNFLKNHDRLKRFENYREILAFPYGRSGKHFDETHVNSSRNLGALKAFSSNSGTNSRKNPFLLRRTAPNFANSPEEVLKQLASADARGWLTNSR